jgi:hypothetical protein
VITIIPHLRKQDIENDTEHSRSNEMPWYYFNEDNSLAYRSDDGRLAPSELPKMGDNIQEVFLENPFVLPEGREDEGNWLFLLDDGTIGLRDEFLIHGSKRQIRIDVNYLQMYAPLEEEDRPENFDVIVERLRPWVPEEVMDKFLGDNVVSNDEKKQILEMCGAL